MKNEKAILKFQQKLQNDPKSLKLMFKIIELYLEDSMGQAGLEVIKNGLQKVDNQEDRNELLQKADLILCGIPEAAGEQYFLELAQLYPDNLKTDNVLKYFTGKQILEDAAKNRSLMESRDIIAKCMEATQYLKDAYAANLAEKYQFP